MAAATRAVHSLLYTLMLFVASLLPVATGLSSWIYLVGASALGGIFIYQAVMLLRTMKNSDAMKMFRFLHRLSHGDLSDHVAGSLLAAEAPIFLRRSHIALVTPRQHLPWLVAGSEAGGTCRWLRPNKGCNSGR